MTDRAAAPKDREPAVPPALGTVAGWSWRLLVIGAALAAVFLLLVRLYVVVVPVVLALFLAAVLEPLVARLRARRLPSALAATIVFVGALAVFAGTMAWVGTSVAGQFDDLGEQLDKAVDDAKDWARGDPLNLSAERVDEIETSIRDAAEGAGGGLAQQAAGQAETAAEVLGGLALFLFTLFFVLKDGARMADWLRERLPATSGPDVVTFTGRARGIMRQYVIATAATGLIDGLLIGLALWLIGVPLVVPLAVLTVLGGFVPIVGATVAGLVAAMVALVTNGMGSAILVVAATIAVQQIEGNLLQPLILERAVRLHPLVTVWAVAAGLVVGGILGAFIAVPLVAIGVAAGSQYRNRSNGQPATPEPATD